MTRVTFTLDSTTSEQLWPLVESVAYLFENVLGVDVVAAVDAHPAATPAQASQDRPRRHETPPAGGTDGPGQESAAERHTRDHRALAQQWANEARAADPALGTVYALAAITHAILATTPEEQP